MQPQGQMPYTCTRLQLHVNLHGEDSRTELGLLGFIFP